VDIADQIVHSQSFLWLLLLGFTDGRCNRI